MKKATKAVKTTKKELTAKDRKKVTGGKKSDQTVFNSSRERHHGGPPPLYSSRNSNILDAYVYKKIGDKMCYVALDDKNNEE